MSRLIFLVIYLIMALGKVTLSIEWEPLTWFVQYAVDEFNIINKDSRY